MRLRRWKSATWAVPVLAALALCGPSQPPCHGQQAAAATPAGWNLACRRSRRRAPGVPTVVVITARSSPASLAFCEAVSNAPKARAAAGSVLFAQMPAEDYASQVKALNITRFPSLIVYQRGKSGLEAVGFRNDLTEGRQVFAWLAGLGLGLDAAPVSAGARVANRFGRAGRRVGGADPVPATSVGAGGLRDRATCPAAIASGEAAARDAAVLSAAGLQPTTAAAGVCASASAESVPAPAPYYVQTQAPAMIVQRTRQFVLRRPLRPR